VGTITVTDACGETYQVEIRGTGTDAHAPGWINATTLCESAGNQYVYCTWYAGAVRYQAMKGNTASATMGSLGTCTGCAAFFVSLGGIDVCTDGLCCNTGANIFLFDVTNSGGVCVSGALTNRWGISKVTSWDWGCT